MSLLVREGSACKVTRAWEGKTVVCMASGPSLSREQVELVRSARARDAIRLIVVNDTYLVAPWADVLYFADGRWGRWHEEGLEKVWSWAKFSAAQVKDAFANFAGQKVTIDHPDVFKNGTFQLRNNGPDMLCENPDGINTGSTSGFQALNIAVHSGGKPILLVGYDFKFYGKKSHAHNGHKHDMPESAYTGYARHFHSTKKQLARMGIEVLNCTPDSAVDAFRKVPLADCLQFDQGSSVVSGAGVQAGAEVSGV